MKNIFAKFQDYVKKPNRNTFDLSFYNNLTLKFGQLTPVFCKEVIPGDSFRINTAFGLQLMPMKFPVQTPMRAYVHYFYVRNRTLWKDWMDFIGGTKEGLTPPYITPVDKEKFYRVGGIADYFGIPNVVYTGAGEGEGAGSSIQFEMRGQNGFNTSFNTGDGDDYVIQYLNWNTTQNIMNLSAAHFMSSDDLDTMVSGGSLLPYADTYANNILGSIRGSNLFNYTWNIPTNVSQRLAQLNEILDYENTGVTDKWALRGLPLTYIADLSYNEVYKNYVGNLEFSTPSDGYFPYNNWPIFVAYVEDGRLRDLISIPCSKVEDGDGYIFRSVGPFSLYDDAHEGMDIILMAWPLCEFANFTGDGDGVKISMFEFPQVRFAYSSASGSQPIPIGSGNYSTTPYDSDIHLNALPFRAYEAIYNAYYRNPQNNPFILNGTPEYNRYNTTYDGGADSTVYDLYFRNWEYDFLTSAVQSPQQGTAPLVGISVTGEATFQDEDGNTYYAQAILNDEGEITGWQSHSSNMPTGSLRLLMDMAGSGISINDLRNVNAFQRFLENNIRRGLKYRDQLMSHFGVKARYDELDMPEFIGGCSTSINVNKLSQTSESGDTPLGSFVGQASAFGQSKHSITHYCDEHGFIIGIMSVVPVPVYSQLLPKFFVKSQQLDYYFPEFGHIGYQPIQQKEVSPLQTYYDGSDLNKVFGYNRAWYDYLASTDEVHGQFRTTMRDFLMNRTFDTEPELSEEFLLVDPEQLNDVFLAGTDDDDLYAPESDKIIGSIYFDVSAKRPIPLFGIPKLTE